MRPTSHPAVADVYDDHVADVYAFLAHRLRSLDDAEDLTQLTFERAVAAWDRYDPSRASAKTWLLAIAHHLLIDHFRRGRSRFDDPLTEDIVDTRKDGAEAMLGASAELTRALAQLTERDRRVIGLRYAVELSGPEIADAMGLSVANVQQIVSRSLRRMRRSLDHPAVAPVSHAGPPSPGRAFAPVGRRAAHPPRRRSQPVAG